MSDNDEASCLKQTTYEVPRLMPLSVTAGRPQGGRCAGRRRCYQVKQLWLKSSSSPDPTSEDFLLLTSLVSSTAHASKLRILRPAASNFSHRLPESLGCEVCVRRLKLNSHWLFTSPACLLIFSSSAWWPSPSSPPRLALTSARSQTSPTEEPSTAKKRKTSSWER